MTGSQGDHLQMVFDYKASPYLYFKPDDKKILADQFCQNQVFTADRERLQSDLAIVMNGGRAPTLFSWWCWKLPDAFLAGEYQASMETLLTAWHLTGNRDAPTRARELLLEQAAMQTWQERDYGFELGHDLSSSHHCRGLAAGLETARDVLSENDLKQLLQSYVTKVRQPYLRASFDGNPYLMGLRNTNWLAHISGSVVIAELAWAKYGYADDAILALARANVMRYVDFINDDGSLPENGDYLYYGLEFALLSLHAWDLHFEQHNITGILQPGLRNALEWPMAFTDADGFFWGDFGDTHQGSHEASRVVGYLMANHFGDIKGQWLADFGRTREPLAPLLRNPKIAPQRKTERMALFTGEQSAAINFDDIAVAIRGGACRSPENQIPHRHYDAGSIIMRMNGVNVICDTGFDRYTDTFWLNFDDPRHERSAARLHNVVLVDGRGFQYEDRISGRIANCQTLQQDGFALEWQLCGQFPGLISWERHLIIMKRGILVVIDRIDATPEAQMISVLWHLYAPAKAIEKRGKKLYWSVGDLVNAKAISNAKLSLAVVDDQPCAAISLNAMNKGNEGNTIVSIFGKKGIDLDEIEWIARSDELVLPSGA